MVACTGAVWAAGAATQAEIRACIDTTTGQRAIGWRVQLHNLDLARDGSVKRRST